MSAARAGVPSSSSLAVMSSPSKVCPICGTRYGHAAAFCQRDGAQLSPEAPPDPFVGKVILGQFRIEEAIGVGGMGTVYRAHQMTLGRDVAVKILHPELTSNPDAVRRFHREARVATKLEHPNLVQVFLFGEMPQGEGLYLVMEYLEGRSLTEVLREEGALRVPRALHIALQICDAVGAAHAQGVVHRDVKPENVMLVRRHGDPDFVKVLDFGIARMLWDEQTALTQSGVIFGTARYISPEGASGEHTDARSDVYSIGVLIYQLLTGVTPFEAPSPVAMLMKHVNDPPPPLRTMGEGRRVPQPVADVVMRALAKRPDRRYADAGDLAAALRAAAEASAVALPGPRGSWVPHTSLPPAAVSPTSMSTTAPAEVHVPGLPTKRPPWVTMLAAFVLGAAAVVGGVLASQGAGGAEDATRRELVTRAEAALRAGQFDAPPGSNVFELTARLLEANPRDPDAQRLRREAVLRLREEAARARGRSDVAAARRSYERILVFQPGDPAATEGLRELDEEEARARRPPPGLRVTPEEVPVGEPVALVATLPMEQPAPRDARFEIWRGDRRLRRVPAASTDPGSFVGSYTFRSAGRYEVRFVAEGVDGDEYRRPVRSLAPDQRAIVRRGAPPPTTILQPQPQPRPPAVMTDDHGIDWSIPGATPPTPPPTMIPSQPLPSEPPAPWTGNVL